MVMINPRNPRQKKTISLDSPREELLHQVVKGGKVVYHSPSIHSIREKSLNQLKNFDASLANKSRLLTSYFRKRLDFQTQDPAGCRLCLYPEK